MLNKKFTFALVFVLICFFQSNAQHINIFRFDNLNSLNISEKNIFVDYAEKTNQFYFSQLMMQKPESHNNSILNLDYLKDYTYKSYSMKDYYIHHRLNITPPFLRDNYALPPYVDSQKIEVVKKKK